MPLHALVHSIGQTCTRHLTHSAASLLQAHLEASGKMSNTDGNRLLRLRATSIFA